MQGPVSARDIALKVLGDVGAHGAAYRSVEFAGNAVEAMSIPDRMVLCDMASETGVRNAYVPPDDKVVEFLRHRAETGFESVYSDPKAEFEKTLEWDVSGLQPQVAADGTMDGVKPVSALEGTPVQRCILGICTNSLQDLRDAARVLKGRKVHPGTRLLIVPASPKVTLDATEDGTLEVLVRAGGVLMNRGGGPCPGGHEWVWAEGEICVSAASRRGPAPTGVSDARVFLTSSATVAASAVEGCIADPRRYWS
jgi:homoaconitase/3-isopropylmalate dehydratase large subunit